MASRDDELKILAPSTTSISRRSLLGGSFGAVALGALASACGGSVQGTSGGGGGGKSTGNQLTVFGWANYNDPAVVKTFTTQAGINVSLDVYNSNEEAIAKLSAAQGTSGYDLYMPTGVYVPEQAKGGLLQELDHDLIPNLGNLEPSVLGQPWDPQNKYTVCKDWGSTGFLYDTTVVKRELRTWDDFVDAMQRDASGQTAVIDAPNEINGLYAWREATRADWTREDEQYLDEVEAFVLQEVAPHVKAYDSYPGSTLAQGKYALMQCWNGDARLGLTTVDDPDRYRWVLGAPLTELWMDNWAIPKGAQHVQAAHAWINWILDLENGYQDMKFHGYNCGLKNVAQRAEEDDLPFRDMIILDEAKVATMQAGALNSATERLVQILAKAKSKSAA